MSGGNVQRDAAGVTVTLEHRTDQRRRTIHEAGHVTAALTDLLDGINPAEWRVLSVSTPRTILADIRGRQTTITERAGRHSTLTGSGEIERTQRPAPEAIMLGRIPGGGRYL